ncbi:MAG: FAD:protein FMN transferase, partial [Deltaproteobacteria bacterium]|nr:FAD:protein FMN transferase [Deltaproteobacteria bacterium]
MSSLKFFKRFSPAIPAVFLLLASCKDQSPSLYKKSRLAMDTLVSISIYADSEESAGMAFAAAFDEIARLEKMLNFYSDRSEISEINRNAGVIPVTVSSDVFAVIRKAIHVSEMTGGAFDITVGAATALWDFKKGIKPDESVLAEKTKLIGFRDIVLDDEKSTVFLAKKGMLIDPGGIVKGYAADRAAGELRKSGIVSGVVAVSGDIAVFGGKPDGSPWEIGVKQPVAGSDEKEPVAVLKLSDAGVSK